MEKRPWSKLLLLLCVCEKESKKRAGRTAIRAGAPAWH